MAVMRRLHASLQKLKHPWKRDRKARWYVQDRLSGDWEGPFLAVEIAYQIHTGALGVVDTVIDGASHKRYVVGRYDFLSSWLRPDAAKRQLLLRGLTRAVRERTRRPRGRQRSHCLTEDQQRAFRLLQLEPSCTTQQIKQRHRALALANHPDRGGSLQRMKEINWAFDVVQQASAL